jgi:hypothetical protein
MNNKTRLLSVVYLLLFVTFLFSCEEVFEPISITGRVIDQNTDEAVSNATVTLVSPEALSQSTISDEAGNYLFTDVAVDSVVSVTVRAEKEGFSTESITVLAAPEEELVVPDIQMENLEQQDDDGGVAGESGGAASLILVNQSAESIRITETGGEVNASFTFEVQDSSGRAINSQNAVDVQFRITEGPNGGESITPEVVRTNAQGQVTSNIFAGNVAGNLKIEALIERPDVGLTIRSKPILLTIHGGFPNLEHFSIAADIFNFEAFSINGNRDEISVIVGDKFSNPVKPGTPVYFNTTGGVIQGSAVTDDDGQAVVELISGDPRPADQYATIRAFTFNEFDEEISREIRVLFSGPPSTNNITVEPNTINIDRNLGGQQFTMELTDINGNPLPFNTRVTITPSDGMTVSGESNFRIPNALFGGPGVTEFGFTLQDDDEINLEDSPTEVSILIEVETPGGFTATKTISGTKAKGL